MKSNEILTVIGVSLLVAVIASLVTFGITGNLIRVPTSVATTQADIYTKAEIDSKFVNLGLDSQEAYILRISSTHFDWNKNYTNIQRYVNIGGVNTWQTIADDKTTGDNVTIGNIVFMIGKIDHDNKEVHLYRYGPSYLNVVPNYVVFDRDTDNFFVASR